jgi:hypothetical protein
MTSQLKTNVLRLIGISAVLFSLSGCTTTTPVSQEAAARIKRVGVVSVTARTFTRQYTGLTIFNNEKETINISDWKVDQHYEELIRANLQKSYGIDAVTASYDADQFEQVGKFIDTMSAPLFESATVDIATVVKNYCAANTLDAILLMRETGRGDGRTNQGYSGAVVYTNGGFGKRTSLYLVSNVRLLDCTTGKLLVERWLTADQSDPMKKFFVGMATGSDPMRGMPSYYIDLKTATTPIQQWSPQTLDEVRTKLLKIADIAIPATLRSIFSTKATAAATPNK